MDRWGSGGPSGAGGGGGVERVYDALHGWQDTAALTMHPLRVSLVRVMDDPQARTVHGVVQVEVSLENG